MTRPWTIPGFAILLSLGSLPPSGAPAATLEVLGERVEGDAIPDRGYTVGQSYLALREVAATSEAGEGEPVEPRLEFVLEVTLNIDCEDSDGRPARCPLVSIWSLPQEVFRLERQQSTFLGDGSRGRVSYVGQGKDILLGRLTGIYIRKRKKWREWVVLDRPHRVDVTPRAVRLLIEDPSAPAPAPAPSPSTRPGGDQPGAGGLEDTP